MIPGPKLKDFLDGAGGAESASEAEDDAGSDGDEAGSRGSVSDMTMSKSFPHQLMLSMTTALPTMCHIGP